MAVSAPNTHVRYAGNRERCEQLRPWGFHLAGELRTDMGFNDLKYGVRTRRFPNGDSIRVLTDHGITWINIEATGTDGVYEIIEETRMAFDLYIDPVLCFDTATGEKIDCTADNFCTGSGADTAGVCESKRLFERTVVEFDADTGALVFTPRTFSYYADDGTVHYDTENFAENMALNTICKAMSQTSTHGSQRCYTSWSKTLDEFTAHAVLYYDASIEMNKWAVVYDKSNVGQDFRMTPGGTGYAQWPVDGYLDVIWCSNTDFYNTTAGYKAFDLWKEDVLEDSGETSSHVFLSITGDTYDRIHVFDLSAISYEAIDLAWRTEYETDNGRAYPAFPEGWKDRHIRLIGLVKRTAYWSIQDHRYGVPIGCSNTIYWESDTEQGSVALDGCSACGAQFAILNEFTQEIEFMNRIACQICDWEDDEIAGPELDYCESLYVVNGVTLSRTACEGVAGYTCTMTDDCSGKNYSFTLIGDSGWIERGNTWNLSYWHWDCLTSRYVCEQTGLQAGFKVNSFRSRDCWYISNIAGGTGEYCATTIFAAALSEPSQGCGWCDVVTYDSYSVSNRVLSGHVLPEGLGYKYAMVEANGEIATCSGKGYNRYTEETNEYESALFDENYAQSVWPYYPPYAILVSGTACSKAIKTDKRKFTKTGDKFIDGISLGLSEAFMDGNCRFDTDPYFIVKGNDNTLYDNKGNEFNRTFEGVTDVGFFFLSQSTKKTRRINEYAD